MTHAEILAACRIAWQQFLVDAKLSPEQMSHTDRMNFQAGYVHGMKDGIEYASRISREQREEAAR